MNYKKIIGRLLLIVFSCIASLSVAFAHSGSLDSKGGHYNHSTGEYHYHHGYSAHEHTNGVCPFNFDDRTGWNSGTGGGSGSSNAKPDTDSLIEDETSDEPYRFLGVYAIPYLLYSIVPFAITALLFIYIFRESGFLSVIGALLIFLLPPIFQEKSQPFFAYFMGCASVIIGALSFMCIEEKTGAFQQKSQPIIQMDVAHDAFVYIYGGVDVYELVGKPSDCLVGADGLPASVATDGSTWGNVFTRSVSNNKRKFHRISCRYAKTGSVVNLVNIPYGSEPCAVCKPTSDVPEWYREYSRIACLKSKYEVT